MSKRKLLASDFDGTIGSGERLLCDVAGVKAFRRAGHLFGLVSGRNADSLRAVCERAGIEQDFRLSDSGGICYRGTDPLFACMNEEDLMIPLAEFLLEKGTSIVSVNRIDGADLLYQRNSAGEEIVKVPREEWKSRPFSQMCGYFGSEQASHAVAKELEERFPTLTALPNWGCLDIVPRGRDKAVGILQLAALLGVERENIYVVGDNFNDIAMLGAFNSFVVENACDEVKKHASMGIVPSVGALCKILMD
jgi:HAD superfamily hydrolase (TIGR01484 family)